MNDVRPRRSALYVPAPTPAPSRRPGPRADVVILDLEDAVAPAAKEEAARPLVAALGDGRGRGERVVRVNGGGDALGRGQSRRPGPRRRRRPLLPKVESAPTARDAAAALEAAGAPASLALWAMLETPRGILAAREVAPSSPGSPAWWPAPRPGQGPARAPHRRPRRGARQPVLLVLAARAAASPRSTASTSTSTIRPGFEAGLPAGAGPGLRRQDPHPPRPSRRPTGSSLPAPKSWLGRAASSRRTPRPTPPARASRWWTAGSWSRSTSPRPAGWWHSPRRSRAGPDRIPGRPYSPSTRSGARWRCVPPRGSRSGCRARRRSRSSCGGGGRPRGPLHPAGRAGRGSLVGPRGLPGGRVEPGEGMEEAAVRETDEEVGLDLRAGAGPAGRARRDPGHRSGTRRRALHPALGLRAAGRPRSAALLRGGGERPLDPARRPADSGAAGPVPLTCTRGRSAAPAQPGRRRDCHLGAHLPDGGDARRADPGGAARFTPGGSRGPRSS